MPLGRTKSERLALRVVTSCHRMLKQAYQGAEFSDIRKGGTFDPVGSSRFAMRMRSDGVTTDWSIVVLVTRDLDILIQELRGEVPLEVFACVERIER